ncbi:hypothetical protein [Flavobacterium sp.]|uniref:hypothetical protein n=1 Tax=Flavobacterium sp. TaxID=239 RepID=UPI0031D705D1
MTDLDVSIIIQGPVKYYKEVIDSYKGIKNVLWCTWEDEPEEEIRVIRESGIVVHLIQKPKYSGYWNVNFQCKSSYEGLLKSKELFDSNYYLKIRSDFKITNVPLLCKRFVLKREQINFLGWANMLEGFFLDYIVFGNYDSMSKYWKFIDNENNGNPCPEIFLMRRYLGDNLLSSEIKNNYSTKLPLLDGIDFYWLSRGINIRDFSPELDFNYKEKKVYYYLRFKIKSIYIKIKKIINLWMF